MNDDIVLDFPPLRPRVIPVLLLHRRQLCKPTRFKDPKYVGDPRVAVKIFNDKGADELVLLDVDATAEGRDPDYALIEEIVTESFMPVAYGGGVRRFDQARRLLETGIEKVVLNSALVDEPGLAAEIAAVFGAQSVVACIDCRRSLFGRINAYVGNGRRKVVQPLQDWLKRLTREGVGEILVQAIEREGTREGYDVDIVRAVSSAVDVPVIALGGAGMPEHFAAAIGAGAAAVAAGTMFVFNGPHRAVLISYPPEDRLRGVLAPR